MKKRKTALFLTAAMTLALAGCGGKAELEATTAAAAGTESAQKADGGGEFSYPMTAGDALT